MKKLLLTLSICLIIFTIITQTSNATILIIGNVTGSAEQLGNFTGELTYDPLTATLTVELTNTSPLANGGYLVDFVFNNPGDNIEGVQTFTPSNTNFNLYGGPDFDNSLNGAPFGYFDIGAGTGNEFPGNGNPDKGIGVGQTEIFTFVFTGDNVGNLTESNFVEELSTGASGDWGNQFFMARFRGFNNGGSDKVPGEVSGYGVIPEPGTFLLLGTGLLGLAAYRYRRSKR